MHKGNYNLSSLKLTGGRVSRTPILGLVFLLCLGAGLLSGIIFYSNNYPADAVSAYITVTDNNQLVFVDQATGDQTITRTSAVTVKNPEAKSGYTLSAKLSQNSISGATVTMGSSSSTTCTTASPCAVVASEARALITTDNNAATTEDGDTTEWQVRITIPAGTAVGNYILDIEYSEERNTPAPTML